MADYTIYFRVLSISFGVFFCYLPRGFQTKTNQERGGVCEKPPAAGNGTIVKVELISHTKVAWYKCNPGYQLHGTKFRVCRPDRGWSGYVKCKVHPVKMKIKDLAFAMEESGEGRAVTVAVGVTIVVVLLLAVHLGRVVATRKSLKTKYEHVLKSGNKPSRQLPTTCEVSNDLLKTTLCCRDSDLPKSFKPRKEKKKKKKQKESNIDGLHEKDHTLLDKNTNSHWKPKTSRDRDFFRKISRDSGNFRCTKNNKNSQMKMTPSRDRHPYFQSVHTRKQGENERVLTGKRIENERISLNKLGNNYIEIKPGA